MLKRFHAAPLEQREGTHSLSQPKPLMRMAGKKLMLLISLSES